MKISIFHWYYKKFHLPINIVKKYQHKTHSCFVKFQLKAYPHTLSNPQFNPPFTSIDSMATATTSFPGAYLRVPPKNGVRSALFSQPICSFNLNLKKPNSLKSVKLSRNSSNVILHNSSKKNSRFGSFVVRCDASGGARVRSITIQVIHLNIVLC